jgi:hypothetical protein
MNASPKQQLVNAPSAKTRRPVQVETLEAFESLETEETALPSPGLDFRRPFESFSRFPAVDPTAPQFPVQANVIVGPSADPHERAADRIAARVVEGVQRRGAGFDAGVGAELRRTIPLAAGPSTAELEAANALGPQIESARLGGRRFADSVRAPMERAFGVDLRGVKVHTDAHADRLNASLGAVAFTTGRDIFFRHGAFAPEQPQGRELLAHELAHVMQQGRVPASHAPTGPLTYVQRRLKVSFVASNLLNEPKDAETIVAGMLGRLEVLDRKIGDRVRGVLERKEFTDKLRELLASEVDEGAVDLDDEQQLSYLYLQVEGRIPNLETGKTRTNQETLDKVKTASIAATEKLEKYNADVVEHLKKINDKAELIDLVILGAGASVAYYLSSSGRDVDLNKTIIIGQQQPWESQRGVSGSVNHPMNMIDPTYQGRDILEEGLASRQEFSERVEKIIARVKNRKKQDVTSVEKVLVPATAFFYYQITAGTDVYYARRVVAGLGIGAHANPGNITSDDPSGKLPEIEAFPRVMDMDTFQQAASKGRLSPDTVKSIVLVGPNAAIDVMSTALRKKQSTNDRGYDEITWVTSKDPFFLPGTDNEFVKKIYEDALDLNSLVSKGVTSKVEIVKASYLGVKASATGVAVATGVRGKPVAKTVSGSIMVYGIGPDVDLIRDVYKNITLVPVYDLSHRFNETVDPKKVADDIRKSFAQKDADGELFEPDWIRDYVVNAAKTIGGFAPLTRELTDAPVPAPARVKEPLLRTLPAVVAVQAARAEGDLSSLEIIGGSAFRLASEVNNKSKLMRYTYVSQSFKALAEIRVPEVEKKLAKRKLAPDVRAEAGTFFKLLIEIAGKAKAIAAQLETGPYEQPKSPALGAIDKSIEELRESHCKLADAPPFKLPTIPNVAPEQESEKSRATRLLTGLLNEAGNNLSQLAELREVVYDFGNTAAALMKSVAFSLPANVALNDQLTPSRSGVEALLMHLSPNVHKGVNLITSDAHIIAAHLASGYESIPAALTNYLVARIVYERRHLPLDKAPLPRPDPKKDPKSGEFLLEQQRAFQDGWNEKFEELDKLFNDAEQRLKKSPNQKQ